MGKELAQNHLFETQHDCSTTALHALLLEQPESKTIEALWNNTYSLQEMMRMLSLEFKRQGILTGYMAIEETEDPRPSRFFKQFYHQLKHGPYMGDFIGGLMLTKPVYGNRHVIAISSIHNTDRPKATIIDTAPLIPQPLIRKVPLSYLDKRIADEDEMSYRAIAIAGKPYTLQHNYFDSMQERLEHWRYIETYDEDIAYRDTLLQRAQLLNEANLFE